MLNITHELIALLQRNPSERDITIISVMVNAVIKCGSKSDADALVRQYLTNPQEFDHSYLLPVFKKWGDRAVAEQLFSIVIGDNGFNENADPELLEVLGTLHYAPIKPILADCIFTEKTGDYYMLKYAALGLLHFDCSDLQEEIKKEIEYCYGKNLFTEFVPALVCKLTDRTPVLEQLYELGSTTASTDCNAGIILGFSLCGEEGRPYFMNILFDPNWETGSSATGTVHYVYEGLKNLGLSFRKVYELMISNPDKVKESLNVFFALLRKRIDDRCPNHPESFADLYTQLFTESTGNPIGTLTDLAERTDKEEEADGLEKLIVLKMNEEVLLRNFIH